MDKYLISRQEIEQLQGLEKSHFLNNNAVRTNKSLGDLTGLTALGFHIIEVAPGHETTELHKHYHEEECVYILEGSGLATVGEQNFAVKAGDFLGYRASGEAHTLFNNSKSQLRCIVVGQRLPQDVADYPRLNKRLYRNKGISSDLVDMSDITHPQVGKKF
tara:strand:- start:559 stop:1041 length:483 start_codon:yes stop_codon:yes gene_type:complete